jgi:dTMP kinase
MNKGKFITLEGGEGVGKTTQLNAIRAELVAAGLQVVVTREPGGTPRAERIREMVLTPENEAMPQICELLLVFAARSTHLHNVILPALARGDWVLCDRFTDASYAYQGCGRGVPLEQIAALELFVQQGVQPDLTLLLDAPVELAMQRARQRNEAQGQGFVDRFEIEQEAFFERVRAGYRERAAAEPERFRVIDASRSLDAVSSSVREIIQHFIAQSTA